ncbi:MAG: hypothetical protein QW735_03465 [archaeon]
MIPDEFKPKDVKDFDKAIFDVKYDIEKLKDPAAVGLLLYRLAREREQTNALFKEILQKLEEILQLSGRSTRPQTSISEIDQKILEFTQRQGRTTAEDVQKAFNYKGKNAASSRLNYLYELGFLDKQRSGKKVFYFVKG